MTKTSSLITPDNIPHPTQRQGRQSWSADLAFQIPPSLTEWSEDLIEQAMSGPGSFRLPLHCTYDHEVMNAMLTSLVDSLAARDRIATVCSIYQEGFDLVQQIKSKRRAKKAVRQAPQLDETTQDLEQSLVRGEGIVRAQYERDSRRFGEPFAKGDRMYQSHTLSPINMKYILMNCIEMARDALRDLISHLRTQVIASLKLNLNQDTYVDFAALQDVSDSSQDRCILILMQLQQRLVTSGPIQNLAPPPLNVPGVDDQRPLPSAPALPTIPLDPFVAQSGGTNLDQRGLDVSFSQLGIRPNSGPLTPPHSPYSDSRSASQVQASSGPSIQQQRPQPPQSPLASSTSSVYSQTQALQGYIDQQVTHQQGSSLNSGNQTIHLPAELPAERPYPTQQSQRPPLAGSQSSFVHPNFAVHPGQPVYNPVIGAPNAQSEASASASQYSLPQSPQVMSPHIQHPPSQQQSAQYPPQQRTAPYPSQQAPVIQPSSQRQLQPQAHMSHYQRQPSAASSIPTSNHQREGSKGSISRFSSETQSSSSSSQYKPIATTTEKSGFLGFRRKKVEMVPEPRENPLVEQYIASAREDQYSGYSQPPSTNGSISTTRSSFYGLGQQPAYHVHHDQQQDATSLRSPASSIRSPAPTSPAVQAPSPIRGPLERAKASMDSITRAPTHLSNHSNPHVEVLSSTRSLNSMNPKDALPNEFNGYAGFCKGAWRQQIGDRKKAIEERVRPGGMYNSAKFLQCKQCKFEGRHVATNKKAHHGFDMRVFKLVEGIQFRWEFLFKSHVPSKETMPDPTKASFGCMFCCAEGRPTPTFQGVTTFMGHLVEHRDRLPNGEVLYRMNCLVGRQAGMGEDFDINIVSREGGAF